MGTIEVNIDKNPDLSEPAAERPITWGKVIDNTLLFLKDRKTAYQLLFDVRRSGAARIVLKDLMQFCKWDESAFHENEHIKDRILGRQDVIRRIEQHLYLNRRKLFNLYNGSDIPAPVQDEENDDGW
jgi:hypothetical protein